MSFVHVTLFVFRHRLGSANQIQPSWCRRHYTELPYFTSKLIPEGPLTDKKSCGLVGACSNSFSTGKIAPVSPGP